MKIEPPHPGPASGPGPDRLRDSQPPATDRPRTPADPGRAPQPNDRVELSAAARALSEKLAADRPESALSVQNLRLVLDRLDSRFYDQPEVQDEILRRLTSDLGVRRSKI